MRYWTSITAVVAIIACTGSGSSSTSNTTTSATTGFTTADSTAIVALIDRLRDVGRTSNWDAWSAEYTSDAVRLPPNAAPVMGKKAIDSAARMTPRFSAFDVKDISVVGNSDLAVATGSFSATAPAGKDASGKATPAIHDEGKFMQSLKKQADGSWKVTKDIWNSNLPLPGAVPPR